MSATVDPRIGSELAGYRIERLLGRGGMGVVYLAHDLRLDRRVALKLLAPELAQDAGFRERFLRESKLAASLDHQNVIPIYEAGEADGQLFLAMRYVEGTDLAELIRAEGPLEPARAVAILAQVASALDTAHARGLVHRDVKPSNILLATDDHAYLADFGLTRTSGVGGPTPEYASSLGTVDYVAPEQIDGEALDAHTDLYSLACVCFETLTGRPPYRADTSMGVLWSHLQADPPSAHAVAPSLPEALDPVLDKALAKDPAARQDSCAELTDDVRDALGLNRRSRRLAFAGLAVLVALAAALAAVLLQRGHADARPDTTPTAAVTVASLQRIDPATNTLVATMRGLKGPSAVSAGEGAVWVSNRGGGTLTRVDPATNRETSLPVGSGARNVLAAGGALWIVGENYELTRYDPRDGHVVQTLIANDTGPPLYLAYGAGSLWGTIPCPCGGVLSRYTDEPGVVRIPYRTDYLATTVEQSKFAELHSTGIAAGGGSVWVVNDEVVLTELWRFAEGSLSKPAARILLDGGGAGVALGAGAVWVPNPQDDMLSRVDPGRGKVVARIPVGHDPVAIAFGDGSVWVANYEGGTVSRVDPATNRVVATIRVGAHPNHIAAGEGGVWVTVDP